MDIDPIAVRQAVFSYPNFTVGPVDLVAEPGVVHGIIGPNGSGKTTLVHLLVGLLRPADGEVLVFGEPARADGADTYRYLGFSPDEDDLVDELSAVELWDTCAVLHARFGADRQALAGYAGSLAERLDFVPPATPIGRYSHGMRRKTQLIAALLHRPRVAILDEPTNGLDPIAAFHLGGLIRELADAGTAFVVTTHDLAWAERFTDRVTVLSRGAVAASGPTSGVLTRSGNESLLDTYVRVVS